MEFMMSIREKTSLLHSASEHSGYIKRIVDGNASVEGYAEYLFNLNSMYRAIEDTLENNINNPVVKDFVTKELYRSELILKDLEFLLGDKLPAMELLASTKACISRILEISEGKPELIIAYAYTRFLADLFGGRTFPALLSKNYNIGPEGLNYYKYDNLEDIKGYVMSYHNKLASLDFSDEMRTEFVNEVSNAYIYNLAISNELEAKLNL
ncbi:biliverdin-producing heme oxygenase [uncultured Clostridium sp.]|uniref:biliverdin-producing heme oxygenase n=1 Tax=uncultured Clostridium sp. TaxID=59620 RepID=UPI00321793A9